MLVATPAAPAPRGRGGDGGAGGVRVGRDRVPPRMGRSHPSVPMVTPGPCGCARVLRRVPVPRWPPRVARESLGRAVCAAVLTGVKGTRNRRWQLCPWSPARHGGPVRRRSWHGVGWHGSSVPCSPAHRTYGAIHTVLCAPCATTPVSRRPGPAPQPPGAGLTCRFGGQAQQEQGVPPAPPPAPSNPQIPPKSTPGAGLERGDTAGVKRRPTHPPMGSERRAAISQ